MVVPSCRMGCPVPRSRAKQLAQAVAFSSGCMRRNGVRNFPDPQPGSGGGMVIHLSSGIDSGFAAVSEGAAGLPEGRHTVAKDEGTSRSFARVRQSVTLTRSGVEPEPHRGRPGWSRASRVARLVPGAGAPIERVMQPRVIEWFDLINTVTARPWFERSMNVPRLTMRAYWLGKSRTNPGRPESRRSPFPTHVIGSSGAHRPRASVLVSTGDERDGQVFQRAWSDERSVCPGGRRENQRGRREEHATTTACYCSYGEVVVVVHTAHVLRPPRVFS